MELDIVPRSVAKKKHGSDNGAGRKCYQQERDEPAALCLGCGCGINGAWWDEFGQKEIPMATPSENAA